MKKFSLSGYSDGFSLVEMMISMALGLVISSALIAVFISSKQNYSYNERVARIQSNGRAALFLLADDLRHVNFWGPLVQIGNVGPFPSSRLGGRCSGWAGSSNPGADFLVGSDDPRASALFTSAACLPAAEVKDNTSAVALKRVGHQKVNFANLSAGQIFLRAHALSGEFLVKGAGVAAPDSGWEDWSYQPKIYFIRDYWENAGDATPSLCAVSVDAVTPSRMTTQCLVEGIEDLHIEYGVDSSRLSDGVPDDYLSSPNAAQARDTVTFKIYLLVRDLDPDPSYANRKTYQLGSKQVTVDDTYRRAVFSTTVVSHNQRSLPVR